MDTANPLAFPLRSWTEGKGQLRSAGACSEPTDYAGLLEAAGQEEDPFSRLCLLEAGLQIAWEQAFLDEEMPRVYGGRPTAREDFHRYMSLAVLTLVEAGMPDRALEAAKLLAERDFLLVFHVNAAIVALAGDDSMIAQALAESGNLGEPTPTTLWARAVLRCAGDFDPVEAQEAVLAARAANPHAEAVLAGPPVDILDAWHLPCPAGSREEALRIAMYFQKPWKDACGIGGS